MITSRLLTLVAMILAAAASRLLPHPPNFAPIGAMALFGGACFANKRLAFAVPLAAMALSDLALGFYSQSLWVYGSFALIACVGFRLRQRRKPLPIAAATLASSILFYVVTNFGVWLTTALYPRTVEGFVTCYVAAIPFFHNTLLGNAVYSTLLFGGLAVAEQWFAVLREPEIVGAHGLPR